MIYITTRFPVIQLINSIKKYYFVYCVNSIHKQTLINVKNRSGKGLEIWIKSNLDTVIATISRGVILVLSQSLYIFQTKSLETNKAHIISSRAFIL